MGKKNNAYNNNKLMTNNLEHMTIVSVNCQTEYYNLQLTWKDRHSNDTSKTQTTKKKERKRHLPFIYDEMPQHV
jgi:hypothetical protein